VEHPAQVELGEQHPLELAEGAEVAGSLEHLPLGPGPGAREHDGEPEGEAEGH
jgi:hypothetical protein